MKPKICNCLTQKPKLQPTYRRTDGVRLDNSYDSIDLFK